MPTVCRLSCCMAGPQAISLRLLYSRPASLSRVFLVLTPESVYNLFPAASITGIRPVFSSITTPCRDMGSFVLQAPSSVQKSRHGT